LTLSNKPSPVFDKKRQRDLPQINERIRFPKIRVIDSDGGQLGVITPQEAIRVAEEQELDLVLVSDKADPPVCRIMDYGKYKFEQEKKAREAKKKQHTADVKEVKMRYKIEEHDYQVRVSQAKRFLDAGDKVKATITFRGREIQHSDLAEDLLKKMAGDLQDFAELQQAPKKEGRNMMMLLSPKATTTTTVTPKATNTTVIPKVTTTTVIPKVTIAPVVKVSSD
jgi:translation initiation factor IF-3